jgi:protein-disulfide isomerase/uncharacterized membrane protein
MSRSRPAPIAIPARAPSRAFTVALLLALAGLGVSGWLIRLHGEAHAGKVSFCNISETINCDKVATSDYSVVAGLPVAVWGALGYLAAAALALLGRSPRRPHPAFPAGLLLLLGAVATAVALRLAYVSEVLIGAWCLFCIAAWTISGALLATGVAATRRVGWRRAIADDLSALVASPRATVAAAGTGLLAVALLVSYYPHYWDHARAAEPPTGPSGPSGSSARPVGTRPGSAGAILFSDYECPYCAIAHAELRATLAARPDIVVTRRNFPLDASCNPVLKGRPMHQHACELARAAICAEAQGKFAEMDDALYENQKLHAPLDDVARGLGLDLGRLHACMDSTETSARVAGDIAAGIGAGLKATPTYVIDGALYSPRLPLELFAPAPNPASAKAP